MAKSLASPHIHMRRYSQATVICEMWDTETQRWYAGKSGHGQGQGQVPSHIWQDIPSIMDIPEWAFGRRCAEVECIIKAAKNGKNFKSDLKGCYFIAYHTG